MIRSIYKGLAAAALALTLLTPTAAATTNIYNYKGQTAQSYLSHTDGCTKTDIFVYGGDQTSRGSTSPTSNISAASVYITRNDVCNNVTLMNVMGYVQDLPEDAFIADRKLNTATLKTTLTVTDWVTWESFPVTLDVTWSGSGEATHEVNHYQHRADGFMINGHTNGSSRPALISGLISDGSSNLLEGMSGTGVIQNAKSGSMVINH